jgi:hypothetical protein
MLTSKSKISEQILRKLRKYSVDSDVDERELMIAVHQNLGDLVRNRLFESKGMESQEVDGSLYYTIRDLVVKQNDSDEYYFQMPSTSVSLPFGVDIKRIATKKGYGFIPVQNGFNDLYRGLGSFNLEQQIGYFINGNDVVFVNMDSMNNVKNVDVTMILPFDHLDEDDDINIPADMLKYVVNNVFNEYAATLGIPGDETANSIDT